jgi:hypothetical protein
MTAVEARRTARRGRLTLAAIFAVCAAPLVVALLTYHFFPPAGRVNYGELIEPKALPPTPLVRLDGRSFALDELKGKWILLQADRAECDANCQAKLFNMRQVRLAQGKNADRVERVWLMLDTGPPPPALARLYEGATIAYGGAALAAWLPTSDARDHIFLVDPLGLVMLRFPKSADPKRMIKDLERLLKYSGIG